MIVGINSLVLLLEQIDLANSHVTEVQGVLNKHKPHYGIQWVSVVVIRQADKPVIVSKQIQ